MGKGLALITGASAGLGAELAKLCAASGYDVVLVARTESRLAELASTLTRTHGVQARTLAADLADPTAPQAIHSQLAGKPLDILINNAGFGVRGPFAQNDWGREASLLQVNVGALIHLTKLFLPAMIERRSGRILNVASTAAFVPGPFMAMYYASKAFVLSFSESIANEVHGTGVTVTALCPGPTRTEFAERAGIATSKLFQGTSMGAGEVAREGFDAMMAGKSSIVAGARNRWMMRGARLLPRDWLAATTRKLNQDEK